MTLAELIQRLESIDDTLAIYAARPWRPGSAVVAVREPADGGLPELARGKTFLTTVGEARRVIASRREMRPGCALTAHELAGAVVYFAIYDAPEPLASLESAEIHLSLAV